jgi:hypothetical protein
MKSIAEAKEKETRIISRSQPKYNKNKSPPIGDNWEWVPILLKGGFEKGYFPPIFYFSFLTPLKGFGSAF